MRFIQVWSYKCACYLAQQLGHSHEKRGIYYYGFQVVIGAVVKGILLVLISLLFGVLVQTLTVLIFFASLRILAGGYHMDTYGKCIAVSLAMFVLAGIIVKNTYMYWPSVYILALSFAIFAAGLFSIIKWAPRDTPNKPITRPEERKKFKTLSIIHICLWIILQFILVGLKLNMYALAGCLGIIISIFIITPPGYAFFDMLSRRSFFWLSALQRRLKVLK